MKKIITNLTRLHKSRISGAAQRDKSEILSRCSAPTAKKSKIFSLCPSIAVIYAAIGIIGVMGITAAGNTSALSYSDNVDVNFTFSTSLTVSLSSADLVINGLTPGTSDDSNIVDINVETNNLNGYYLSSTVGNSTDTTPSHNTTNLVHSNNTNAFTSLSTSDNITSLDGLDNNTWGYSYSTDNRSTWSSYSGLPLYTSTGTTLSEKYTPSNDTINFKIAAKASTTQPAGEYTNVINFTITAYPSPMSLADSYAYFDKTMTDGYYTMQDMEPGVCALAEEGSELQVKDIRDQSIYWIAKLKDDNCWMTQNLDLDIGGANTSILTSENTDLNMVTDDTGVYCNGYSEDASGIITWTPESTAITSERIISGSTVTNWSNSSTLPYSAKGGNVYYYTSGTTDPDHIYNSISECQEAGHTASNCAHYHRGSYYNWTAAIASNNSSNLSAIYTNSSNSICPASWRLPKGPSNSTPTARTHEFGNLFYASNITNGVTSSSYTADGLNIIRTEPLFFVRGGGVSNTSLFDAGYYGDYWSTTTGGSEYAFGALIYKSAANPAFYGNQRALGRSVRCLANN